MSVAEQKGTPGGGETGARRGRSIGEGYTDGHEVEVELTDAETTVQQRQAYERFWKLLLERLERGRAPDKND